MNIHLLSSPGSSMQSLIDEVSKGTLLDKIGRGTPPSSERPVVLYVPPRIKPEYVELTRQAFTGLADVRVIDLERVDGEDFRRALAASSFIFVPGGNTFLLNHQIHSKGLFEPLRQAVCSGIPYLGFSAGMLVAGQDILTTNDFNACGCATFDGFGFVPFNFAAHYPSSDGLEREKQAGRIAEYQAYHTHPVLALEDDAYLQVEGEKARLVKGSAWWFENGKAPVKVLVGEILYHN